MKEFTEEQEYEISELINKIIDKRVDLIVRSLSIFYEPEPLTDIFDQKIDSFSIDNAYCFSRLSDFAYKDVNLLKDELDRSCTKYKLHYNKKR